MAATALYPPGPKPGLLGGHLFALQRDPTAYLLSLARDYGDIVHFKVGPQHVFLLNHPDFVKDVLVTHHRKFVKGLGLQGTRLLLGEGLLTSERDVHRRQRRLSQPAFHRQRLAAYGSTMVECAARMGAGWHGDATGDVAQEMMHLTLAIVGKTLFGSEVEAEAEEVRAALADLIELFDALTLPFAVLLARLPLPRTRRFQRARARLDAIIYRMLDERRARGEDRGDLLSILLRAQDAEGDGEHVSDAQLRDQIMTLFLAGHETTATALTWTWYLLSQHPEAEARLHAELDQMLAGRLPTADDLPQLHYTWMVLAESMRLYPPAWVVGRQAVEACTIGGYVVPAGASVVMSPWVIHHDRRYYPDPFRFDPERWTPEAQAVRPRFAYFPFGAGPRVCIGEQFARMEMMLVLATLARQWRMRLVPGHPVELQPLITLRPRRGIRMTLEQRFR